MRRKIQPPHNHEGGSVRAKLQQKIADKQNAQILGIADFTRAMNLMKLGTLPCLVVPELQKSVDQGYAEAKLFLAIHLMTGIGIATGATTESLQQAESFLQELNDDCRALRLLNFFYVLAQLVTPMNSVFSQTQQLQEILTDYLPPQYVAQFYTEIKKKADERLQTAKHGDTPTDHMLLALCAATMSDSNHIRSQLRHSEAAAKIGSEYQEKLNYQMRFFDAADKLKKQFTDCHNKGNLSEAYKCLKSLNRHSPHGSEESPDLRKYFVEHIWEPAGKNDKNAIKHYKLLVKQNLVIDPEYVKLNKHLTSGSGLSAYHPTT